MSKKAEMTIVKCKRCGEDVLYYPDKDLCRHERFWSLDKKELHIDACFLKVPRTKAEKDKSSRFWSKYNQEQYEIRDKKRTINNANLIAEKKREVPFKLDKHIKLNQPD